MKELFIKFKSIIDFVLFSYADRDVTVAGVLIALVIVWLAFIIATALRKLIFARMAKVFKMPKGSAYALGRIVYYSVVVLGFLFAAQFVGVNLSSLLVIFGFLGVGIGFGLQNITSNFISGLILLMERPVAIGDMISIEGDVGEVKQINMRATVVNTIDNITIIVPNSKFVDGTVINWSHTDERVRLRCPVGVAYGSDIEKIKQVLLEVACSFEDVLKQPKPEVRFLEFGESSLNIELLVWTDEPSKQFLLKSDINYSIDKAFRENNIKIPFPQRDIHLFKT